MFDELSELLHWLVMAVLSVKREQGLLYTSYQRLIPTGKTVWGVQTLYRSKSKEVRDIFPKKMTLRQRCEFFTKQHPAHDCDKLLQHIKEKCSYYGVQATEAAQLFDLRNYIRHRNYLTLSEDCTLWLESNPLVRNGTRAFENIEKLVDGCSNIFNRSRVPGIQEAIR
jgi:hypothetical protein